MLLLLLIIYNLDNQNFIFLLLIINIIGLIFSSKKLLNSLLIIFIIILSLRFNYNIPFDIRNSSSIKAVVLNDSKINYNSRSTYIRLLEVNNKDGSSFEIDDQYYLIDKGAKVLFIGDIIYIKNARIKDKFIYGSVFKSFHSGFYKYRSFFHKKIEKRLEKLKYKDLLMLLFTGTSPGDVSYYTTFSSLSSLSHVIAISGLHLHLIIALLSGILRKFKYKRSFISLTLIFYFYIVGPRPSIIRSLFLYLISNYLKTSFPFSLKLTLLIHLLFFKDLVISLATSLSYGCVYILYYLSKKISSFLIFDSLSASISLSLYVYLILSLKGIEYNFISIILSSISVLLISLIFISGLFSMLINDLAILKLTDILIFNFRKLLINAAFIKLPKEIYIIILIFLSLSFLSFYYLKKKPLLKKEYFC